MTLVDDLQDKEVFARSFEARFGTDVEGIWEEFARSLNAGGDGGERAGRRRRQVWRSVRTGNQTRNPWPRSGARCSRTRRPGTSRRRTSGGSSGYKPELFLVATGRDELVGTAMGGYDRHRGWVYYVAVKPTHRRRGIGAALMQGIEDGLVAMGCPKLDLQVRATNRGVLSFYRSLGYVLEDRASLGKRLRRSSDDTGRKED